MKISLCMIVKNEDKTLARCLSSVKDIVDEIIIVDTGSEDTTKDIARKFTDKVYDFEWVDDFSAARNYAFSFAQNDFVMWLDADDILSETSGKKLLKLKSDLPEDVDIIYMPYDVAFDENDKPIFTYYRERIVRRSANPVWIEPVHEVIDVKGRSMYTDISVQHRKIKTNPSERNLKIMEKQLAEGKVLSPRLQFYYARELMYNGKTPDAVNSFEKFLADKSGWFENKICACYDLSVCYEKIGNGEKAFETALKGLMYAVPRNKTLCRIGELFMKCGQLIEAEYWYQAALNCHTDTNLGFNEIDYGGFIPAIQLCVIYDKLGNPDKAEYYNEIAGGFRPDSPAYMYNKKYFKKSNED
ncbi:MAG: glycosyltransferase family 2 protein [Clostridia bacterium]|nr:glycosyltransferase family 2 protein [Clostridia bacterium]